MAAASEVGNVRLAAEVFFQQPAERRLLRRVSGGSGHVCWGMRGGRQRSIRGKVIRHRAGLTGGSSRRRSRCSCLLGVLLEALLGQQVRAPLLLRHGRLAKRRGPAFAAGADHEALPPRIVEFALQQSRERRKSGGFSNGRGGCELSSRPNGRIGLALGGRCQPPEPRRAGSSRRPAAVSRPAARGTSAHLLGVQGAAACLNSLLLSFSLLLVGCAVHSARPARRPPPANSTALQMG